MQPSDSGRRRRILPAACGVALLFALWGGWRLASGKQDFASLVHFGQDTVPHGLPVPTPDHPLLPMEMREDFSEELAVDLHELGERLQARDLEKAAGFVSERFEGRELRGTETAERIDLGLGASLVRYRTDALPVVDHVAFVRSMVESFKDGSPIDAAIWQVSSAEFQQGSPIWGRAVLQFAFLGTGPNGDRLSIRGEGAALVAKRGATWMLEAFDPTSLEVRSRPTPLFTDVARTAGLDAVGAPWGQVPNKSFSWHGAASGDVNGDGLWDLFVPDRPRNFLYVARPDGGWVDEAEKRGVATPGGGTGAVLFDYDNDGDLDLALADDAHQLPDGTIDGTPLRFYRREGEGDDWRYREVGSEVGVNALTNAYSLVAFDYDQDGWLDLFVTNYAPERRDFPSAWIDAENGTPDLLYHNLGGRNFEEVAKTAGIADHRWGYAAAAADYDRDGDQDLYIANDFGLNRLWRNDGGGRFTDVAEAQGTLDRGFGMSASWADLDNDGHLDLYVSNMSSRPGSRILDRMTLRSPTVDMLRKMASGNSLLFYRDGRFEAAPASFGAHDCEWAWGSAPSASTGSAAARRAVSPHRIVTRGTTGRSRPGSQHERDAFYATLTSEPRAATGPSRLGGCLR